MKIIDKIRSMSTREIVDLLEDVVDEGIHFFDEDFCLNYCEHGELYFKFFYCTKNPVKRVRCKLADCPYEDESPRTTIARWLESEVVDDGNKPPEDADTKTNS